MPEDNQLHKIKEVIQPHVPVRLPCGDLAPLAKLKFDFPN